MLGHQMLYEGPGRCHAVQVQRVQIRLPLPVQVPPQLPKVFAEYIELLEDGGAANQPQLAKRLKANSKRAAEITTKEMTERLEAYMPTL